MSHKKPVWVTNKAHSRLKEYCKATGRTQLEVVSNLILTNLSPDGEEATSKRASGQRTDRHLGGVWVV